MALFRVVAIVERHLDYTLKRIQGGLQFRARDTDNRLIPTWAGFGIGLYYNDGEAGCSHYMVATLYYWIVEFDSPFYNVTCSAEMECAWQNFSRKCYLLLYNNKFEQKWASFKRDLLICRRTTFR